MEGTRPILVELQALVSSTSLGTPRRTILGLDHNRVALLVAVMEKKLGMHLMGHDMFMNVAGGVQIWTSRPWTWASWRRWPPVFWIGPFASDTLVLGEVGLAGEVRAVGQVDARMSEARKMGFTR